MFLQHSFCSHAFDMRDGIANVLAMSGRSKRSVTRGPPWWAAVPKEEWPDGLAEDIADSGAEEDTGDDNEKGAFEISHRSMAA